MVLESRIRELESASQRERIARSLHDGYMQALAGVNLRLETCRELLRRGRHALLHHGTFLCDFDSGLPVPGNSCTPEGGV